MKSITLLGATSWRNTHQNFGIRNEDRFGHIYCLGKTGVGKSTLILNMAISDIQQGNGFCLIDPHGDLSETLLDYVPTSRIKDVVYFFAGDFDHPIGFNPIQLNPGQQAHLVVAGLIASFKKIWIESWGPRLEYILRYCLLTLIEYPNATLLDIQTLLTNHAFRSKVLLSVGNQSVQHFWKNEFDKYPPALKAEAISPILNKTGVFEAITPLRNIIGQSTSTFSLQEVMDQGKILIVNLSKGMIGEDAASLLGSMLLTAIQLTAVQRASIPEQQRRPFFVYVDEMQSFVTTSFVDILAEARKYKLSLFLTHQYLKQLSEPIQSAILGNVGTLICFRIGAQDAAVMAREFHPTFGEVDLVRLPKYAIYLKLMIDGATSKPFSATTLPLDTMQLQFQKQAVLTYSQATYGRPVAMVEYDIAKAIPKDVSVPSMTLFSE